MGTSKELPEQRPWGGTGGMCLCTRRGCCDSKLGRPPGQPACCWTIQTFRTEVAIGKGVCAETVVSGKTEALGKCLVRGQMSRQMCACLSGGISLGSQTPVLETACPRVGYQAGLCHAWRGL